MIYETICKTCSNKEDIVLTLAERESMLAPGFLKCICGGILSQIISSPKHLFTRSPFPIGISENVFEHPVDIKSKQHVKDLCQEHGFVSKRLENDTI